MQSKTPSLLVLYCGGVIGMTESRENAALEPSLSIDDVLSLSPFLTENFSLQTHTVSNLDSTNMQPHHWEEIAQVIENHYDTFDGFVVVHGTDTMAYTATAISFALRNLGKPVVFTGAQIPPSALGSDAFHNLTTACQVACLDLAEVVIAFGSSILRGNRTTKVSESSRDAFASPAFSALGSVQLEPEIDHPLARKRHYGTVENAASFAGDIAVLKLVPGLPATVLNIILDSGIDGLILESFGPGNIPNQEQNLLPCLSKAKEKGIPVLISSQCIYSSTRMYLYDVSKQALDLGVIPTGDMTPEAAYVKLKWALGQTENLQEIASHFQQDLAGELTVSGW